MKTPSKKFRIALVGTGGYGEQYLPHLLRPEVQTDSVFCAAVDPFPERCSRLAELKAAGIPFYPDLESFYAKDHADLVVIAAPIQFHAPFSCLALARGSNVLCEKPLCARTEEAQAMMAAERASGLAVAIGYQWSFSDAILELKRDILSGLFGKPLSLKTLVLWPRRRSYYMRNSWAGRIRTESGQWVLDSPLNNAAAHYLHNMLYLLGDSMRTSVRAAEISAELSRANPIENYDTAALRILTEGGTDLRMYVAHPIREANGPLSSFTFERAIVESGSDQVFRARFTDGRVKAYGNPDTQTFHKLYRTIRAIQDRQPVSCGIEAAFPHTLCINRVQDLPVADVPEDRIRTENEGNDPLIWVEGLAEEYLRRFGSDDDSIG